MPKFRKKPVVIEAVRFTSVFNLLDLPEWVLRVAHHKGDSGSLFIKTLEGIMEAKPGDWIIQGVEGEVYPCKLGIFEATYEPVAIGVDPALPGADRTVYAVVGDSISGEGFPTVEKMVADAAHAEGFRARARAANLRLAELEADNARLKAELAEKDRLLGALPPNKRPWSDKLAGETIEAQVKEIDRLHAKLNGWFTERDDLRVALRWKLLQEMIDCWDRSNRPGLWRSQASILVDEIDRTLSKPEAPSAEAGK
jgi:hypothetical protein